MQTIKRATAFFFAMVLASILGCASTPQREGTGEYVDDSVITTKVKAAIFREPTLKVFQVNVETYKGRVQLSGFVNSQDNITRATEVASSVLGVTSITNDIRLR